MGPGAVQSHRAGVGGRGVPRLSASLSDRATAPFGATSLRRALLSGSSALRRPTRSSHEAVPSRLRYVHDQVDCLRMWRSLGFDMFGPLNSRAGVMCRPGHIPRRISRGRGSGLRNVIISGSPTPSDCGSRQLIGAEQSGDLPARVRSKAADDSDELAPWAARRRIMGSRSPNPVVGGCRRVVWRVGVGSWDGACDAASGSEQGAL